MSDEIRSGDSVARNTPQNKTRDKTKKKAASENQSRGHGISASPQNPEHSVESEKSGRQAARKSKEEKKTRSKGKTVH